MRKNRVLGKYSHTETYLPVLTHQLNTQRHIHVHIFSFTFITKFADIHFFLHFQGDLGKFIKCMRQIEIFVTTQGLP